MVFSLFLHFWSHFSLVSRDFVWPQHPGRLSRPTGACSGRAARHAASRGSGCAPLCSACFLSHSPWMPQAPCLCLVCIPLLFLVRRMPVMKGVPSLEAKPGWKAFGRKERREQCWCIRSWERPAVPESAAHCRSAAS